MLTHFPEARKNVVTCAGVKPIRPGRVGREAPDSPCGSEAGGGCWGLEEKRKGRQGEWDARG